MESMKGRNKGFIRDITIIFHNIVSELRAINIKLDLLMGIHTGAVVAITNDTILNLPQHLQRTMKAILQLNKPSMAHEISAVSGRVRALESSYCNELVRMGILIKHRDHRRVLFTTSSGIDKELK